MVDPLTIVSLLLTGIAWFIPILSIEWKLVITLAILSAALVVLYAKQRKRISEIEENRKGLIEQHDKDFKTINTYEGVFENLGHLISAAAQSSEAGRISKVYEMYVTAIKTINSGRTPWEH